MKTEMNYAMNAELSKCAVSRLHKLINDGMDKDELIITHPKGSELMPYAEQDIEYNPKYFCRAESRDNSFNYIICNLHLDD